MHTHSYKMHNDLANTPRRVQDFLRGRGGGGHIPREKAVSCSQSAVTNMPFHGKKVSRKKHYDIFNSCTFARIVQFVCLKLIALHANQQLNFDYR